MIAIIPDLILLADVSSGILLAIALRTALAVDLHWNPDRSTPRQLMLEKDVEWLSPVMGVAEVIYGISTILWIVSIAMLFPRDVPGAMCGTGVMQAMAPYGGIALMCRSGTVVLLYAWHALDRIRREHLGLTGTREAVRVIPVIGPLAALGAYYAFRASRLLIDPDAVSCCAALMDEQTGGLSGWIASALTLPAVVPIVVFLTGSALAGMAWIVIRRGSVVRCGWRWGLAIMGIPWSLYAGRWAVGRIMPYCFGVLHHDCVWCLFLPVHHAPGFAFLLLLLASIAELTVILMISGLFAGSRPALEASDGRIRQAALRFLLLSVLYAAICLGYPLLYRLRFGVFITG